MKKTEKMMIACGLAICLTIICLQDAQAQSVMNDVMSAYSGKVSTWGNVIKGHAVRLYWGLTLISMVWTFGFMALKRADLGEFFAEFVRFTASTGFFFWFLDHGPEYAKTIINSMWMIGGEASGIGSSLDPQSLFDAGLDVFDRALNSASLTSPVMTTVTLIMAGILAALFALVALEVLITVISAWVLGYAGVIFLGFGGGRWTSDMAINYYKTIFQLGVQIMTITLLMGVGKDIVLSYASAIGTNVTARGLMTLIIVVIVFYGLFLRVPSLVSGVALGSFGSTGVGGGGAFGSAAVGAIGTGIAAASMGKAMIETAASSAVGGAVGVAGAASALKAAFGGATEASKTGTGMFPEGAWGGERGSGAVEAFGHTVQFSAEIGRQFANGIAAMSEDENTPSFGDRVKASVGGRLAEHIRGAAQDEAIADKGPAIRSASEALDPSAGNYVSDEVREFVNGTRSTT